MKGDKVYRMNPKIGVLFGIFGIEVKTKQDSYKPASNEGIRSPEGMDLYLKKDDKESVRVTKKEIAEVATDVLRKNNLSMIGKPSMVEVVISISIKQSRFEQVDIDNLSKTVLDGLIGIAFENDSQVVTLLAKKHVYEENAVLIGITDLSNVNMGLCSDTWLFKPEE
jgi:Holliday junction resolvase RusA-like endonuclease